MRLAAAIILTTLTWTACSVAGPTASPPIESGKPFSLRVGDTVQSASDGLRIGFDGVSADSRCPKGEQCVWAGDAILRVWLQQGSGPRLTRDLHAAPRAGQAAVALGHELRLVRLDPYPISGKVIAARDYVATLTLTPARSAAADPDR